MPIQEFHEFSLIDAISAIGIALLYILLSSVIKEPNRQNFNAIMISGAGAAYLNGGFGLWEMGFCTLLTFTAFKGLKNYHFIGIGWLLHTFWDILHHLYGNPIISFIPLSSAGCAICDIVLALWFFCKAPSIFEWVKNRN